MINLFYQKDNDYLLINSFLRMSQTHMYLYDTYIIFQNKNQIILLSFIGVPNFIEEDICEFIIDRFYIDSELDLKNLILNELGLKIHCDYFEEFL